jgi:hypothetical protein
MPVGAYRVKFLHYDEGMVRWFLFILVAVSAWSQTTGPAPSEAESRLRERVGKFYSLLQEGRTSVKSLRQAEELVAEDSKDQYYVARKPIIGEFHISSVELIEGGQKAKVVLTAKVTVMMVGAGPQEFQVSVKSTWKMENGEWMFYMDPVSLEQTPFGKMYTEKSGAAPGPPPDLAALMANKPSVASLQSKVKIDRTSVVLTPDAPVQFVTISNELSGSIDISMDDLSKRIPGLTVSLGASRVEGGKSTQVKLEAKPGVTVSGTVHLFVAPLGNEFDVQVKTQ